MAAGFLGIASLPIFKIDSVEIIGARLVSQDEALRLANISIGENLFLARFDSARGRLLELPVIKKVDFKRILPSKVIIKIAERKEAVVCVLKNQSLILDADGVVLNPQGVMGVGINLPDITNLPVMNGLSYDWFEEGMRIRSDAGKDVLELLAELENFIIPQKLQIDVSEINDIKLLIDDVLKVRIGSTSDLQTKMNVFKAIYPHMKDYKSAVDYIDVSSHKFPVVKFKH